MSKLVAVLKSTIAGALIFGTGWVLMNTTVPNENDARKTLSMPVTSESETESQKRNAILMQVIMENAKSDRPAWDVRGCVETSDVDAVWFKGL